jgi:hypothetical protein
MRFRLENEAPQTTIEITIENILTDSGIEQSEIQFRGDKRYLRVGYWNRLSEDILARLNNYVKGESEMYDEDCGYLFYYEIKH